MITMDELLNKKYSLKDQRKEVQDNLSTLLTRVNVIRTLWNKPMIVTSGLRTLEDHLRIYQEKGITDPAKIPMKSRHLIGAAVDVSDPELKLTTWLKGDKSHLEVAELWCEDKNKNWVHFQIVPPASGNRWFLP